MRDSSTSEAERLNLAEFYSGDSEVFRAKYKQLEHLIGRGHHGPSEGDYCEDLLKEFLRRTLPGKYSVDSGFIRRVSEECVQPHPDVLSEPAIATPQLDIIVHDSTNYAPIFRSGDFVVILPQAARAVIEVKKCLNRKRLKEAVKTIGRTRHLLRRWDAIGRCNVVTCVFAFSSKGLSPKNKQYSDSVKTVYSETMNTFDGCCEAPDLLIALPDLAFLPVFLSGRQSRPLTGQRSAGWPGIPFQSPALPAWSLRLRAPRSPAWKRRNLERMRAGAGPAPSIPGRRSIPRVLI